MGRGWGGGAGGREIFLMVKAPAVQCERRAPSGSVLWGNSNASQEALKEYTDIVKSK